MDEILFCRYWKPTMIIFQLFLPSRLYMDLCIDPSLLLVNRISNARSVYSHSYFLIGGMEILKDCRIYWTPDCSSHTMNVLLTHFLYKNFSNCRI